MNTKKAIAIGLITSAIITLVAFGIKTNTFKNIKNKTTTPTANKQVIRVNAEEETLTDTIWYFNDTLEQTTPQLENLTQIISEKYYINFKISNTTYQYIDFNNTSTAITTAELLYNTTTAYTWADNQWSFTRTIEIIDGTDVTNQNLINWFKRNATKITIRNLTNTSWKINETLPTITAGQLNSNIIFYNNGNRYTWFSLGYSGPSTQANCITYGSYIMYNNGQWQWTNSDQTYRQSSRIIITGGLHATSKSLIVWLTINATQYQEITTTLNTKWTFIDKPISNYSNFVFDIQFTTGRKSCLQLKAGWTENRNKIAYSWKVDEATPYAFFQVYDGTYWADNTYKTIIIINGDDVTSLEVISWLTCNADGTAYQPIPINPDIYDIENGNFVSLQSLMIQILTMPFTFISQAFNVTLWPNTAWEFNLSNFILGIIAIASLLFLIKLFTSGFSVVGKYTQSKNEGKFKRNETKINKTKNKK